MPHADPHPLGRGAVTWLAAAAAVGLYLIGLPWTMPAGVNWAHEPGGLVAISVVTAVPAGLFLAASWRECDPRLRQALGLIGVSLALVAAGTLLRMAAKLGVGFPPVTGFGLAATLFVWAVGFAGLIRLPLAPLARGDRWRVATDVSIAVVGMGLTIFVGATLPGMREAPAGARTQILVNGLMETANLVALNLILVRGPARAIQRAVWCLAATIVVEIVYLVVLQYAIARGSHDSRFINSLFFLDYLAYIFAGALVLAGRTTSAGETAFSRRLRVFNPLPVVAVCGVGAQLIVGASGAPGSAELPLAIGLVVMTLLLAARVLLATWENLKLLREEAADDRRRQSEKMEAMGRLAAGISHVINNLMTVVLGHAELGLESVGDDGVMRDNLETIGSAAGRAAALAARLRAASGHSAPRQTPRRLADLVRAQQPTIARIADGREVVWEIAESADEVQVGESELALVLHELVSNARDAMPEGGRVRVRTGREQLGEQQGDLTIKAPPGDYAVVEVADTGRGVAAADLARIFEPFYTTRPLHEGRGLGLSVVHGIVSGCGGALRVRAAEGVGLSIAVYLPLAATAAAVWA